MSKQPCPTCGENVRVLKSGLAKHYDARIGYAVPCEPDGGVPWAAMSGVERTLFRRGAELMRRACLSKVPVGDPYESVDGPTLSKRMDDIAVDIAKIKVGS